MYVEVRFDIESPRLSSPVRRSDFEGKYDFWGRVIERVRVSDRPYESVEEAADNYEQRFEERFPGLLESLVNQEMRQASRSRTFKFGIFGLPGRKIAIRLVTIEYGSLMAVLDVAGITSSDMREFVLALLTVYSPAAFRQAVSANVSLNAAVQVLGEAQPNENGKSPSNRGVEALGRAWLISNTSLLVPVGLALLICYYVFSALTHEVETVRSQAASAQAERAEVLKAIVAQNAKISDLMVAHASSADPNVKALTEVLLTLVKSNVEKTGNPKP
jgi:hypothetical protein